MSNDPSPERRRAPRIHRQESVSIQLLLPCLERPDAPRVVTCETADISPHGLRLLLSEPVEPERILDLCIELDDDPQRFLLTAETRWCRRNDRLSCYEVGLFIHDSEGTDYREWFERVSTADGSTE